MRDLQRRIERLERSDTGDLGFLDILHLLAEAHERNMAGLPPTPEQRRAMRALVHNRQWDEMLTQLHERALRWEEERALT